MRKFYFVHFSFSQVDFQMCFFGPSTYDLTYASFTLFSKDLRDQKREVLLNFYFVNFTESLKKLQVQQPWPNFEDFQNERKRWSCFGRRNEKIAQQTT